MVHWCGIWYIGVTYGTLVWHMVHWCGIWYIGVAYGTLVWHMVHWCGIWYIGVAYGTFVWHMVHWCAILIPTSRAALFASVKQQPLIKNTTIPISTSKTVHDRVTTSCLTRFSIIRLPYYFSRYVNSHYGVGWGYHYMFPNVTFTKSSTAVTQVQSPGPEYRQFGFMPKMEVPCT